MAEQPGGQVCRVAVVEFTPALGKQIPAPVKQRGQGVPSSQRVISTLGVAAYTAGTVTLVRPGGSCAPAARAAASSFGRRCVNAAATSAWTRPSRM